MVVRMPIIERAPESAKTDTRCAHRTSHTGKRGTLFVVGIVILFRFWLVGFLDQRGRYLVPVDFG